MDVTAEKLSCSRDSKLLRRVLRVSAVIALSTQLSACGNDSMEDLKGYVKEVLARKADRIEELPPIEPYVIYAYQSVDKIDPFEPLFQEQPQAPEQKKSNNGLQPDFNRNREELEAVPLDAVRMMGTLELKNIMWGIVRSPDNIIHRVQVGNYIGRNHGKVVAVLEDGIELTEIIPDGQGGWSEREASIALIE